MVLFKGMKKLLLLCFLLFCFACGQFSENRLVTKEEAKQIFFEKIADSIGYGKSTVYYQSKELIKSNSLVSKYLIRGNGFDVPDVISHN